MLYFFEIWLSISYPQEFLLGVFEDAGRRASPSLMKYFFSEKITYN